VEGTSLRIRHPPRAVVEVATEQPFVVPQREDRVVAAGVVGNQGQPGRVADGVADQPLPMWLDA
jgi:hypothetical protein